VALRKIAVGLTTPELAVPAARKEVAEHVLLQQLIVRVVIYDYQLYLTAVDRRAAHVVHVGRAIIEGDEALQLVA